MLILIVMLSMNIDAIMFAACAHAAFTCADALASLGSVSMRLMIMGIPSGWNKTMGGFGDTGDSPIVSAAGPQARRLPGRLVSTCNDALRGAWVRYYQRRRRERAFFDERRIKILEYRLKI